MEEEEIFKKGFYELVDNVMVNYDKNRDEALKIVGYVVNKAILELTLSVKTNDFLSFYAMNLKGSGLLKKEDFTNSQLKRIINETALTERDRKIAHFFIFDKLSEEDIATKLQIDKKTVHSNIIKIRLELRKTASKIDWSIDL